MLGVLALLFGVFTNIWTERLWFDSVGYDQVFTTQIVTQVGLFVVFAVLTFVAVVGTAMLAYRLRPRYRPMSVEQQSLERYREAIEPSRRAIVLVGAGILGITSGLGAAASWQTFLVWLNREPFGTTDPQFNVDVGFYIFEYPWWRFLLSFGFATVILSLITAVVVHYLYGGIRLQSPGEKVTPAAIAHISALAALLMLTACTSVPKKDLALEQVRAQLDELKADEELAGYATMRRDVRFGRDNRIDLLRFQTQELDALAIAANGPPVVQPHPGGQQGDDKDIEKRPAPDKFDEAEHAAG